MVCRVDLCSHAQYFCFFGHVEYLQQVDYCEKKHRMYHYLIVLGRSKVNLGFLIIQKQRVYPERVFDKAQQDSNRAFLEQWPREIEQKEPVET